MEALSELGVATIGGSTTASVAEYKDLLNDDELFDFMESMNHGIEIVDDQMQPVVEDKY